MMKLYKGQLSHSVTESDIVYQIKTEDGNLLSLRNNDVLLLKDNNNHPMSIIGPLPEQYSITALKELLGEYYPVFVQAAFDEYPVELCRIDLE